MKAKRNHRALTSAASTLPHIHYLPSSADTSTHAPPPTHPQINPPVPPPPNPTTFDSSASLTVLVLLSALFFLGFFSLYIRRCIAGGVSSSYTTTTTIIFTRPTYTSPQHKGLDAATIGSMPSFAYGGGGVSKYQTTDCSVCLSDFEEGETVKVIPHCEHLFHGQCIDRWLYSHASCPICRSTTHQKP